MILRAFAESPDRKFGHIFSENMRVVRFSDSSRGNRIVPVPGKAEVLDYAVEELPRQGELQPELILEQDEVQGIDLKIAVEVSG